MRATKIFTVLVIGFFATSCVTEIGPAGEDGVVEIYTSTIVINSNIDFGVVDEFVSIASYEWNNLDEATVDYGVVLGYLRFEGSTNWHALPFSTPFENDVVVLRYSFDINNFDLIIEGEVADNNEVNEAIFDGDELRVVAIPSSLLLKGKGIDYSDYEQVARLYNLER
ncbi:MAG: hypothetical protein RLN81_10455 [Balneolaceae bacterium]